MRALLDFLVPARCAACGAFGDDLCGACFAPYARGPLKTRSGSAGAPAVYALGSYEGMLRQAILALKYQHRARVGLLLGRALGSNLQIDFDVVVPVPLHPLRLHERGYNQARHIADGIRSAKTTSLVVPEALTRVRATRPQSTLALQERASNVDRAFAPGEAAGRLARARVLLVDDVATTGATLGACAAAIWRCGARSVAAACLAIRI